MTLFAEISHFENVTSFKRMLLKLLKKSIFYSPNIYFVYNDYVIENLYDILSLVEVKTVVVWKRAAWKFFKIIPFVFTYICDETEVMTDQKILWSSSEKKKRKKIKTKTLLRVLDITWWLNGCRSEFEHTINCKKGVEFKLTKWLQKFGIHQI